MKAEAFTEYLLCPDKIPLGFKDVTEANRIDVDGNAELLLCLNKIPSVL